MRARSNLSSGRSEESDDDGARPNRLIEMEAEPHSDNGTKGSNIDRRNRISERENGRGMGSTMSRQQVSRSATSGMTDDFVSPDRTTKHLGDTTKTSCPRSDTPSELSPESHRQNAFGMPVDDMDSDASNKRSVGDKEAESKKSNGGTPSKSGTDTERCAWGGEISPSGLSDLSSVDEYQATPRTIIGSPMGLPGWPIGIKMESKESAKLESHPIRAKRDINAKRVREGCKPNRETVKDQLLSAGDPVMEPTEMKQENLDESDSLPSGHTPVTGGNTLPDRHRKLKIDHLRKKIRAAEKQSLHEENATECKRPVLRT